MSYTEEERRKIEFMVGKEFAQNLFLADQIVRKWLVEYDEPNAKKIYLESVEFLKRELQNLEVKA